MPPILDKIDGKFVPPLRPAPPPPPKIKDGKWPVLAFGFILDLGGGGRGREDGGLLFYFILSKIVV